MKLIMIRGALLVGAAMAFNAFAADKPIAFRAEAKVDLDAHGKPLNIEVSKDLPEPIRAFIKKRVGTYHFSKPSRDGRHAAATTYLSLGACALPADGGYRMAVDLKGNGPGIADASGRLPPPAYPRSAATSRQEGFFDVHYVIDSDGRALLQKVEERGGQGGGRASGFDSTIRSWVKSLRFEPEIFDGQPVKTAGVITLNFILPDGSATIRKLREEQLASIQNSAECRVAGGGEGLLPVALDSPVKIDAAG